MGQTESNVWVACRVWRGFASEAKAFRSQRQALDQVAEWTDVANPDYDHAKVFKVRIED